MNELDLKRFELFQDLSEAEREAVVELLEPVLALDDGEPLFAEGQESDGLVLVQSGALRVGSLRAGELGRVGEGECLGAASLVAIGAREVSAEAQGETQVWRLTRESFRRLADDEPRAGVRILEAVLLQLAGSLRRSLASLG